MLADGIDALVADHEAGEAGGYIIKESILGILTLQTSKRVGGIRIDLPSGPVVTVVERGVPEGLVLGGPRVEDLAHVADRARRPLAEGGAARGIGPHCGSKMKLTGVGCLLRLLKAGGDDVPVGRLPIDRNRSQIPLFGGD